MPPTDQELLAKVESHLQDLVRIYGEVFDALRRIDRTKYGASQLKTLDEALDSPGSIEPAKAAAVLKAILGSVPGVDRLELEWFYQAPFDRTTSGR